MDHKHLDIYLLRCLTALVSEAHVTRAAERMGMTQPAMSATLGRLRTLLADPLLVRTDKGMVATPRALELAASVHQAIELIDKALAQGAPFESANSQARFEIAASESVAFVLMPALIARLRQQAPGVSVRVHVPELARVRHELEEGHADLVVSFLRGAPEGLRSTHLLSQRLCVIAAASHPDVRGAITLEQYLRWPHAYYTLGRGGGSTIETAVDEALAAVGKVRTLGAWLPSTLSSPAVVASSDLLATVPERIARHFAATLGLQVLAPPLPLHDVVIAMYWHDRMHNNPAHRWLRERLRDVAAELQGAA